MRSISSMTTRIAFVLLFVILNAVVADETNNHFDLLDAGKFRDVVLLVESSLYHEPQIQQRLSVYCQDLENEDYRVNMTEVRATTPGELRAYLQSQWTAVENNLIGAVLIGDLPLAEFWFTDAEYARPIDLYYMDLDGNWLDVNTDGVFDSHPNDGREGPDIWIGRIMTHNVHDPPDPPAEVSLMIAYFDRIHAYREGRLPFRQAGMVYTRDWQRSGPWHADDLEILYSGMTTLVMDPEIATREDYQERLATDTWEWHTVIAHGSPGGNSFLGTSDIHDLNPRIGFYHFESCSFTNYTVNGYAAGQFIFNTDYGLAGTGWTRMGRGTLFRANYFESLSAGGTMGEAHKAQLNAWSTGGFTGWEFQLFGLTLLGDPTLCPKQAINSNLRVLSVTPAHGVTVGQVTRISSEFTQDILLGDLDSSTFFLSEAGLDRRLGTPDDLIIVGDVSTVSPRIASLDLQLTYPEGLPDGLYQINIVDDIVDSSGWKLDGEYSNHLPSGDGVPGGAFQTEFQVDRTGPRIASMYPPAGSLIEDWLGNLHVSFDEKINRNTLNSKNVTVKRSGGDGVFGNGNDVDIEGTFTYDADSSLVEFGFHRDLGKASTTYAMNMHLCDNYAYVADYARGVCIFDVSDPTGLRQVGRVVLDGNAAAAVDVVGRYAFVANRSVGLAVVDVSDPTQPFQVNSSIDTPGWAVGVDVHGGYAYVADMWGGPSVVRRTTADNNFWVIDVQDPECPEIVNGCRVPGRPNSVRVKGDYAYVASGQGGLRVIDISAPKNRPVGDLPTWGYDTPGDGVWIDVGSNSMAYLADGNGGLRVFDVTDPAKPTEISHYPTPGYATHVRLAGQIAVVTDLSAGVLLLDVSLPEKPRLIQRYDNIPEETGRLDAWLIDDLRLALALNGQDNSHGICELRVVDISPRPSDVYQVILTDSLQDLAGKALDGEGNYLYPGAIDPLPSGNSISGGDFVASFLLANTQVVAFDDYYETSDTNPLSVDVPGLLANDTKTMRTRYPLRVELIKDPNHGKLIFNHDGSFIYTPDTDFLFGTDQFVYKASDELGNSDIAEVKIRVNPFCEGQLCGTFFTDLNGNGLRTPDEPGLSGQIIQLQRIEDKGRLLQTFQKANPLAYDHFGHSIAEVAGNVLVGARSDHVSGPHAGSAYLFDGSAPYDLWPREPILSILNPTPEPYDFFGWPVAALGGDVLIGASRENQGDLDTGAIYRFNGTNGRQVARIPGVRDAYFDWFGYAIAPYGNDVLVGSRHGDATDDGSVYLFNGRIGGILRTFSNPTPSDGDCFGSCISVAGTNVLVGSPFDDTIDTDVGAAYLFEGSTGNLLFTFPDPDNPTHPKMAAHDNFGISVANLGTDVLVGARYSDIGGIDAGAVFLFDGTTGDLIQTFRNPTPERADNFGYSIGVVDERVLIGAYKDDTGAENAGAAYLFDASTGHLLLTFQKSMPARYDYFGISVGAMGTNVLIGAPYDDTIGTDVGKVFLFEGALPPHVVTTNANGHYSFTKLESGTYQLNAMVDDGRARPDCEAYYVITVAAGENLTGLDFGVLPSGEDQKR